MVKAYETYFGGKDGNGTYQQQINLIPPHTVFMSLCLGNCAVTRRKKKALVNILNDLDENVIDAWKALPLDGFIFHNTDVVTFIKNQVIGTPHDNETTFIYLDPTYPLFARKQSVKVYKHEMTNSQHSDLLSQIKAIRAAKVMICSYPNILYDEALKDWHTHDFYSTTRKGQALERVYYNYEPTDQLHDYSYLGSDFREREANTRIIKNMAAKLNRLEPLLRNAIIDEIFNPLKQK